MELPVVASDVMGVGELVEQGESGLLVRPSRPDLVADAIARLAGDETLRRRMGDVGRRKVLEEFDIRRSGEQLREVFEETLERQRSAQHAGA